jgi:hypothetical protein
LYTTFATLALFDTQHHAFGIKSETFNEATSETRRPAR